MMLGIAHTLVENGWHADFPALHIGLRQIRDYLTVKRMVFAKRQRGGSRYLWHSC